MAFTTINKSTDYYNTSVQWSGNDSTQTISGVGLQPDLTWVKAINDTTPWGSLDSVRGSTKWLRQNDNTAEETKADGITSFNSDGFAIGANGYLNDSNYVYRSWNWKAGTTTGIATNGSTTITPSAYSFNQTSGISIIKYTGNDTAGAKVPHGLGAVPKMIFVKTLGGANAWNVYHVSNGAGKYMLLDSDGSVNTNTNRWNDTEPDSVNFTLGSTGATNGSGGDSPIVAYCFAEKSGFSRMGKYTGDGSSNGQFIYTGFKPAWILVKCETHAEPWLLWDNKRAGYNVENYRLMPNETTVENTSDEIDILSNGFKWRSSGGHLNGDGRSYIYMAFGQTIVGTNNNCATAR
tara:strand:+ start:1485 stop:2531 length:1047 start_codon:yes stop_codon:yes gene_type:complete